MVGTVSTGCVVVVDGGEVVVLEVELVVVVGVVVEVVVLGDVAGAGVVVAVVVGVVAVELGRVVDDDVDVVVVVSSSPWVAISKPAPTRRTNTPTTARIAPGVSQLDGGGGPDGSAYTRSRSTATGATSLWVSFTSDGGLAPRCGRPQLEQNPAPSASSA